MGHSLRWLNINFNISDCHFVIPRSLSLLPCLVCTYGTFSFVPFVLPCENSTRVQGLYFLFIFSQRLMWRQQNDCIHAKFLTNKQTPQHVNFHFSCCGVKPTEPNKNTISQTLMNWFIEMLLASIYKYITYFCFNLRQNFGQFVVQKVF